MATEPGTGIPKPRLQSLSDLIFGLALSIGALTLINANSASNAGTSPNTLSNIIAFGFSFLILMTVWFRYTKLTSILPFETSRTVYMNAVMLFFVAIEPYLFNLLFTTQGSPADQTEIYYAVDLGGLFLTMAYMTQSIITQEKTLDSPGLVKYFAGVRNLELLSAAVFLVSILPIFWTVKISGEPLRIYVWVLPLVFRQLRRRLFSPSKKETATTSPNPQ